MPTAIDLFEKARTHERVEQLRAAREQDLLPYFRLLTGPAGPVVEMEGTERVMLGSNNYLGLTGDPRVKEAARDALVFTTGYQANVGCLSTLLEPGDTVICDSGDHASIMDGVAMSRARIRPFRHNRLDKLEEMLERAVGDGGGILVVVDGVYSMEGDVCELPPVVDACRAHGARLMVDEAHAVGVLGRRGAGTCELYDVEGSVDLR